MFGIVQKKIKDDKNNNKSNNHPPNEQPKQKITNSVANTPWRSQDKLVRIKRISEKNKKQNRNS